VVSVDRVRLILTWAGGSVIALGLGVELWHWLGDAHGDIAEAVVAKLSLSYETNLPTWYSSSVLLCCALACGAVGAGPHWWGLAAGFTYISLDETVQLHEHLGGTTGLSGGILYFDWVIYAAVVVVVVGVLYLPFLRTLPPDTRHRFLGAGMLYIGGAVILELPLGYWTERAGSDNLTYAMIDWIEESLEIAGASLFLVAVLRYRERAA
jgi:hypothetical protein